MIKTIQYGRYYLTEDCFRVPSVYLPVVYVLRKGRGRWLPFPNPLLCMGFRRNKVHTKAVGVDHF
jgi:hypothetical protein